jgi:hypothetical protein
MNLNSVFSVSFVFSVIAFSVNSSFAESKWTLTTADFQSRQVELSSIDEAGVRLSDSQVKWDDLLLLDREASAKDQGGGKFTLYLASGDQLRGEPTTLQSETLKWNSPALGAMDIPLKQVASLARTGRAPAGDEKRSEDVITLANGDVVRGILSGLADGAIKIQSQGNEVAVPLDTVASVALASSGSAAANPPRAQRSFRVTLADDSIITATALRSTGDKLALKIAGGERAVPLNTVAGIEQLDGPVSWLSSRSPSENVQTPLLDTTRPAKMDRTVTGKPIAFGDRVYARGIGVTPYSKITWSLNNAGAYKAFRTQYALAGRGTYADVTVRIKLDDKIVHETKDFTAGELSPVVVVPLSGAKSLTLEVDFGGNYNVQDQLNWIEPALVKSAAVPRPAPANPTSKSAQ